MARSVYLSASTSCYIAGNHLFAFCLPPPKKHTPASVSLPKSLCRRCCPSDSFTLFHSNLTSTAPRLTMEDFPPSLPSLTPPPPPNPLGFCPTLLTSSQVPTWRQKCFHIPESQRLSFFPPVSKDERLVAICPKQEVESAADSWIEAVECCFADKRPFSRSVIVTIKKVWKPQGSMKIFPRPDDSAIFTFSSQEDRRRVLEYRPWFIMGQYLYLRPWSRDIRSWKEFFGSMPIWIRLPNLPLHFWSPGSISKIASVVGNPLFLDDKSANASKLKFVRVCVEASARNPLPKSVLVEVEGDDSYSYDQIIEYESAIKICSKCSVFGHFEEFCEEMFKVKSTFHPKRCLTKPLNAPSCQPVMGKNTTTLQFQEDAGTKLMQKSAETPKITDPDWILVAKKKKAWNMNIGNTSKSNDSGKYSAVPSSAYMQGNTVLQPAFKAIQDPSVRLPQQLQMVLEDSRNSENQINSGIFLPKNQMTPCALVLPEIQGGLVNTDQDFSFDSHKDSCKNPVTGLEEITLTDEGLQTGNSIFGSDPLAIFPSRPSTSGSIARLVAAFEATVAERAFLVGSDKGKMVRADVSDGEQICPDDGPTLSLCEIGQPLSTNTPPLNSSLNHTHLHTGPSLFQPTSTVSPSLEQLLPNPIPSKSLPITNNSYNPSPTKSPNPNQANTTTKPSPIPPPKPIPTSIDQPNSNPILPILPLTSNPSQTLSNPTQPLSKPRLETITSPCSPSSPVISPNPCFSACPLNSSTKPLEQDVQECSTKRGSSRKSSQLRKPPNNLKNKVRPSGKELGPSKITELTSRLKKSQILEADKMDKDKVLLHAEIEVERDDCLSVEVEVGGSLLSVFL